MSVHCEEIISHIDGSLHDDAVAKFAQILADCESPNWMVAQASHEHVREMTLSMAHEDYERFLTESTECMVTNEMRPNSWLPG